MHPLPEPSRTPDAVARVATTLLGIEVREARHVAVGYTNENWRVTDGAGGQFIVKFGPRGAEAKWRASLHAAALANEAGVALPRLVVFERDERALVRIYEWIEGTPPSEALRSADQVQTFFQDLGRAAAVLHSLPAAGFSSRLDGSVATFDRWMDYVMFRLEQILDRCEAAGVPDVADRTRARDAITALAPSVDDVARPVIAHRDLHDDNLLADADGHLVGILDFDMAEAWDAAAEYFKLEWMLFPHFSGSAELYEAAYTDGATPARWEERKRLVHLLETLNAVPNWRDEQRNKAMVRLRGLLQS